MINMILLLFYNHIFCIVSNQLGKTSTNQGLMLGPKHRVVIG